MQVVVVEGANGTGAMLTVRSPAGELSGRWRGAEPVAAGTELDVELDVATPQSWAGLAVGEDTSPAGRPYRGFVEAIAGTVIIVRIGTALMQVEVSDPVPEGASGGSVAFSADDLEFWPTGI